MKISMTCPVGLHCEELKAFARKCEEAPTPMHLFGLEPGYSSQEVERVYKRLALQCYPDKHKFPKDSEEAHYAGAVFDCVTQAKTNLQAVDVLTKNSKTHLYEFSNLTGPVVTFWDLPPALALTRGRVIDYAIHYFKAFVMTGFIMPSCNLLFSVICLARYLVCKVVEFKTHPAGMERDLQEFTSVRRRIATCKAKKNLIQSLKLVVPFIGSHLMIRTRVPDRSIFGADLDRYNQLWVKIYPKASRRSASDVGLATEPLLALTATS